LPELVELVMAKPSVSAGILAKTLEVTPQTARRIILELGLSEMAGRERFRAWGVTWGAVGWRRRAQFRVWKPTNCAWPYLLLKDRISLGRTAATFGGELPSLIMLPETSPANVYLPISRSANR